MIVCVCGKYRSFFDRLTYTIPNFLQIHLDESTQQSESSEVYFDFNFLFYLSNLCIFIFIFSLVSYAEVLRYCLMVFYSIRLPFSLFPDNPLHCSCDSQELWEWLKDHQKWIAVADSNQSYLKCEQPVDLRGRIFAQMEPQDFCELPLIAKLAIQDIQPFSVVVSWQKREHSGLNGFEVKYQQIDADIEDVSIDFQYL